MLDPLSIIQGSQIRLPTFINSGRERLVATDKCRQSNCLTREQWVMEQTGKLMGPPCFCRDGVGGDAGFSSSTR